MNKELGDALVRMVAAAGGLNAQVMVERLAIRRMGVMNKAGEALAVHARINVRAEAEASARSCGFGSLEDLRAFEDFMEARVAQYAQLDEEQEAADLGFSSVEEMLVARRTPNLAYDSVGEYSLLDEDQEVEQRALWELKAIWNQ